MVWVPDEAEGFIRGSVQSDQGDYFRVSERSVVDLDDRMIDDPSLTENMF